MKEGYIPKEQRKNILLLTDDIRLQSGVANVGKEIVIHTSHKYNWYNVGGAIQHPELGKIFDISEDVNGIAGIEDSSVKVQPYNGYGDPTLIRQLIKEQNIDAIFLITDPRYFEWLFQIENEIRKKTPIIYLNIWDDYPAPMYNKAYYESCDLLMGISKQTVNINKLVLGDKIATKIIDYVPHGMNSEVFYPIKENSEDAEKMEEIKKRLFGGKESKFTLFFNSRNIRRKSIPDTMLAWKYFVDQLPQEEADSCYFVLHTDLVSEAGTDLKAVRDYLFGSDYKNIIISSEKVPATTLNAFYNIADAQILLSSAEGWGLALTEAMLTGTPIIGNVTGGMQDQMRFEDENGDWFTPSADVPSNHTGKYKKHGKWAFPVFPNNRSLVGSPRTPYIWDDRCRPEDATEQIMKLYNMSHSERKEAGLEGLEWATGDEAGFTSGKMAKKVENNIDKLFATWTPRKNYELINTNQVKGDVLPHKLLY
jgi:glycosyltransferase involved in cell wall biosynthesis|tara:strand:- start:2221 stop:3660 length:1440 start_codon:yes stop_codon:yes gene_type:complete